MGASVAALPSANTQPPPHPYSCKLWAPPSPQNSHAHLLTPTHSISGLRAARRHPHCHLPATCPSPSPNSTPAVGLCPINWMQLASQGSPRAKCHHELSVTPSYAIRKNQPMENMPTGEHPSSSGQMDSSPSRCGIPKRVHLQAGVTSSEQVPPPKLGVPSGGCTPWPDGTPFFTPIQTPPPRRRRHPKDSVPTPMQGAP